MSELVEITVPLLGDHPKALEVSKTGSGDDACFLWKRDIAAYEPTGLGKVWVSLSRQLARERSLL